MSKKLNIAVIGTGRMGVNHVRVISEMEGVNLVAVVDFNRELAERVAKKYFVESVYDKVETMLGKEKIDAAIVATPTSYHYSVGRLCIEHGLHVFLEKPMASTVKECDELINLAKEKKLKLMIGHIERFNPVIVKLKEFLNNNLLGDVYYLETVRSGPFPKRLYGSKDGVVIDLAVHDLDLIDYLFGKIGQVYAHHIKTKEHKQDIYARVMFKTQTGVIGSSEFSWISPKKERRISVYGDKGMLLGNLLDQEVWFFENGDVSIDYSDNYYQNVLWGRVSEGKVTKYPIKKEEPLKRELEFFFKLLKKENNISNELEFDPSYGKRAVDYSLSVLESADRDKIIYF